MIVKKEQAKVVMALNSIPIKSRDMYGVAANLDWGITKTYNYLQVLERKGAIKKEKSQLARRTYYTPTQEGVQSAMSFLEADLNE